MSRVSPNANAILGLNQIGVWIEAGVHQSDGYAFARESGIGVYAKAGRQGSEGGLCIQRPCCLNRIMQGRVSFGKQRSQEILLNASRTPVIVTIPERVPLGFGQHDFALGIPTHRA